MLSRLPMQRAARCVRAVHGNRARQPKCTISSQRCFSTSTTRHGSAPASPVPTRIRDETQHLEVGHSVHGFGVARKEYVAEYDAHVVLFKHHRTGAELLSLGVPDENKTFGAVFNTTPTDDTGVAHITEHSVFCGSRKYPLKEPFVELLKGSLQTFLNAMTYPDRTVYPVASCNLRDFYNLVDVYLDAMFFPRAVSDPKIFAQEGWHYELEKTGDDLAFKGVVFNEMKGVYSSPSSMHYRNQMHALFSESPLNKDSGGDPEAIPLLTYEKFCAFYRSHYHPANARFWFYGDDPVLERLRLLDNYLANFSPQPAPTGLTPQPLWDSPREATFAFAADRDQDTAKKSMCTVNWVLTQGMPDDRTQLLLGLLNHLLIGTPASPLYKALSDSGLGDDVFGGGLDADSLQPTFSAGLKNIKQEDSPKVLDVILRTLEDLSKTGFERDAVRAAVNTTEFSLRENNTGSYPRGLILLLRCVPNWLYGKDPVAALRFEESLSQIKRQLDADEPILQQALRQFFLDNNHRLTAVSVPDKELGERRDSAEKAQLQNFKRTLNAEQIEKVMQDTHSLKEAQSKADSPEALSSLPSLEIADISAPQRVSKVVATEGRVQIVTHELPTNGIAYLTIGFDISRLQSEDLALLDLFCEGLTEMGTKRQSFVQLTHRIGMNTGGLSAGCFVGSPYNPAARMGDINRTVSQLMISGKSMAGQVGSLLEIINEIVDLQQWDNPERFKQLALERKAAFESKIVSSGHSFAGKLIASHFSLADWVNEQTGGLSAFAALRKIVEEIDADWPSIYQRLQRIHSTVFGSGIVAHLTADAKSLQTAEAALRPVLHRLASAQSALEGCTAQWGPPSPPSHQVLLIPTQVNYVAKGGSLAQVGYTPSGSAFVISKLLNTTWLWNQVRVTGGAYGGFGRFNPSANTFIFASYRDPNLGSTLRAFDDTASFLRSLSEEIDKDTLKRAIIGAIGEYDAYQLPDAKAHADFLRHLTGLSEEERDRRRNEILNTQNSDLRTFADALAELNKRGVVTAFASEAAYQRDSAVLAQLGNIAVSKPLNT
eukprot:TRINITY_DN5051_c0_g1_i1.p1 TRINITY_DN5051_c0_g1~~TRINITY_DN5051_c0_g1_i1.p1  ORF type:complete len:1067 (-),score=158.66 TRINITY_DN5051_c0_g1_i1:9-3170(-)